MTCQHCGRESTPTHEYHHCIANLRADLHEARTDLAEAEREDAARAQFDAAISESTNAMMKEALGLEMCSRLWGVELERLGYACDQLRANLAESRKKELDAETRACATEERAQRLAEAWRRLLLYHDKFCRCYACNEARGVLKKEETL